VSDPGAVPTTQPRYTGGQIAMMVIGAILLLPGLCSLLFMLSMISELRGGDPIVQMIAGLWVVCFFLAAVGGALIYVARKDARAAAASKPGPDADPKP
jgi:hypothetical protein